MFAEGALESGEIESDHFPDISFPRVRLVRRQELRQTLKVRVVRTFDQRRTRSGLSVQARDAH